jgi:hypothetical protein
MILPRDRKYLIIYTVKEKSVGHRPFKKVTGQYTEFLCKFWVNQFRLFRITIGTFYDKIESLGNPFRIQIHKPFSHKIVFSNMCNKFSPMGSMSDQ